ncbi:MAG: radical SAM protein [Patescibacteria group bacterium]
MNLNAIVKVTTLCPGNCRSCIHRKENFIRKKGPSPFFDLRLFDDVCRNIRAVGGKFVSLSGGEPTIVPNIERYIATAQRHGLTVRMNTNGWWITRENVEKWLDKGLNQIVLSLYGTDKDLVALTRGNKFMYEKTRHALAVLRELKKTRQFIFIVQTILLRDNYRVMPEIFKAAITANADVFWPSYLEDAKFLPDIRMTPEDIRVFRTSVIPRMIAVAREHILMPARRAGIMAALRRIYRKRYDGYRYHRSGHRCRIIGHHFTFYPDGTVDPCPGHEYFPSRFQQHLSHSNVDMVVSRENLARLAHRSFRYCRYCPQGEHVGINFTGRKLDEHAAKGSKSRSRRIPVTRRSP